MNAVIRKPDSSSDYYVFGEKLDDLAEGVNEATARIEKVRVELTAKVDEIWALGLYIGLAGALLLVVSGP